MVSLSQVFHLPKVSYLLNVRAAKLCGYVLRRNLHARLMSTVASSALTNSPPDSQSLGKDARKIFDSAVNSVLPGSMVKKALRVEDGSLVVNSTKYPLHHNVHIIGFGKAVLGMARAAEDVLGDHVVNGVISIPTGIRQTLLENNKLDMMLSDDTRLCVHEGATNNIPDENAQKAAMAIYELAKSMTKKDLCLTLITGGGSALLPAIIPPLTLSDMTQVTKVLSRAGATIQQLNTVRKNLDLLKGGGLAATAQPAKMVSLILSDVIGNPLDLIASGPTVHDSSSPGQCLDVFRLLNVDQEIPLSVHAFLEKAAAHCIKAKERSNQGIYEDDDDIDTYACNDVCNAQNVIVGSNEIMVEHAQCMAQQLGYLTYILSTELSGEAKTAGDIFADLAAFTCLSMGNKRRHDMQQSLVTEEMDLLRKGLRKKTVNELLLFAEQAANQDRPMCILAAGETVVKVTGSGRGGRNQELALWTAVYLGLNDEKYNLSSRFNIKFLSAGTDGQDGPTDVAGAFVKPSTCAAGEQCGLDAETFLENNDSHTFFTELNRGENLLRTGLTGTNVMDLQVLLIRNANPRSSLLK